MDGGNAALIGLIVLVIGGALVLGYIDITKWEPERERAHAAACAAKGLKPASHTEQRGKTSATSRFCVDADGRVYWL